MQRGAIGIDFAVFKVHLLFIYFWRVANGQEVMLVYVLGRVCTMDGQEEFEKD